MCSTHWSKSLVLCEPRESKRACCTGLWGDQFMGTKDCKWIRMFFAILGSWFGSRSMTMMLMRTALSHQIVLPSIIFIKKPVASDKMVPSPMSHPSMSISITTCLAIPAVTTSQLIQCHMVWSMITPFSLMMQQTVMKRHWPFLRSFKLSIANTLDWICLSTCLFLRRRRSYMLKPSSNLIGNIWSSSELLRAQLTFWWQVFKRFFIKRRRKGSGHATVYYFKEERASKFK